MKTRDELYEDMFRAMNQFHNAKHEQSGLHRNECDNEKGTG